MSDLDHSKIARMLGGTVHHIGAARFGPSGAAAILAKAREIKPDFCPPVANAKSRKARKPAETPTDPNVSYSFVLPYPPSTNHLFTTVRGNRMKSAEARSYAKTVAGIALSAGVRPIVGPVAMTIIVYRPRKTGDLDNSLKAILDGLKGIAWADDEQVKRIVADSEDDKDNPRAEVTVRPRVRDAAGGNV